MYISQDFWRGQYLSGGYNTYLFGVHSVQSMEEECIHLESKYLKRIHEFMVENSLKIVFNHSYIMPLQRENDCYLMDVVILLQ